VDLHLAVPARTLAVAKALRALPPEVFIVGCEPGEVDELTTEMTPPVQAAVGAVLEHIDRLLANGSPGGDPVAALQQRDEILQIMFWLHGEGLGPDVSPADILRFVGDSLTVRATLRQLVEEGFAEPRLDDSGAQRYRLTTLGMREGRRRFLDEFEPYLARHAHGECGSADCDCHSGGGDCRSLG